MFPRRNAAQCHGCGAAVRSERDKEFQRRQENITGPKSLKRGIHMHQIRTKPAYVEQMVN